MEAPYFKAVYARESNRYSVNYIEILFSSIIESGGVLWIFIGLFKLLPTGP